MSCTVSCPILHKLAVFISLDACVVWVVLSGGAPEVPLPGTVFAPPCELLILSPVPPLGVPVPPCELGCD